MLQRIILTTGGTGGHIFPALAVAQALRERNPGVEIVFAGSLYGPEKDLALEAGLRFEGFAVRGFLGRGWRACGAALGMLRAVGGAVRLMRRFRPQVVAGFGGYAAFAPVLAARLCGIPTAIHEQNSVAGVSNKVLGRLAHKVYLSMPGTQGFDPNKCELTGNPVRAAVAAVGRQEHNFGGKHLLVVGGSQGARALNTLLVENVARLSAAGIEVWHQTGTAQHAVVAAAYAAAEGCKAMAQPFITDMAAAYAWADLVLCRAGASTTAELAAAGRGAVFIPFPRATHDHQTCNARLLAQKGAALLVPEKDSHLALEKVLELMGDSKALEDMAAAAKAEARPEAADHLARALMLLAQKTA